MGDVASPLTALPAHVLAVLLSRLDAASLCALGQTCRLLYAACCDARLWPAPRAPRGVAAALAFAAAAALRLPPGLFASRVAVHAASRWR